MSNLALFDFDGTITTADTFTAFIRFAVHPLRLKIGSIVLSPLILLYKMRLIHGSPLRRCIVFLGLFAKSKEKSEILGREHCDKFLKTVLRPNAMERIAWHKAQGDAVVIVSASMEIYLKPWCENMEIDLICNKLASFGNLLTGLYSGPDCTGQEKANRIQSLYNLKDYPIIYAYGDTKEDDAMLSLAHKKYFRWQEVKDKA